MTLDAHLAPGFAAELRRQRELAQRDREAALVRGDDAAAEDASARLADLEELLQRSTGPIVLPDAGASVAAAC